MIRVYYRHPNPSGGYYECEHSMPVNDLSQWVLRVAMFAAEYRLVGVLVTRIEQIYATTTEGEAEYYAKYGTAGEF